MRNGVKIGRAASSGGRVDSSARGGRYSEPGSPSSAFVEGPRFRAAEAEIARLKSGHAREMEQMRVYVETLRSYGEAVRRELEVVFM